MSKLRVYNTLTQQKETFRTLEEGKVKMYFCGPTVYNYIHIGNARPPIVFDTVRRYLEFRGYDVQFVSNFTDVDDKIIRAAQELGEDVLSLANRFIEAYHGDVQALGVKKADRNPRVTETMDEIIEFIEALVDKGYAYSSGGDVYFRTRKFKGYGQLSHQSVDELRSGARIEIGENKEDPLDFTLWKAAKPGEISWKSPWGEGRPGWHIECSTMVKKYLGDTIDIHAGGQDLIFPHHENEIAQSEALTDEPMARYWLHNGYININNEKMSKSLGNFILVHDLIKERDPQVIRFFMLSVQYRNPINFTGELLDSAAQGLERIRTAAANVTARLEKSVDLGEDTKEFESFRERFIEEMDDDFNTANAISVLFELAKQANVYLQGKNTSKKVLQNILDLFKEAESVLGVSFMEDKQVLDEEIESLIQQREEARKERNFALSDEIRDQLKEMGVVLEDTKQGVRWRRKTS
ncbi:MAG TPA: cysteine--tRNA ligase [Bacillales bacterium]|nr:cysteine--tRNA ligase [Bacillales bacterium]